MVHQVLFLPPYVMAGIRTRISQTVAPPLKGRSTDSASATTAFKNDFNHQDPTIFESLSQFQLPSLAERDSNLGLDESLAGKKTSGPEKLRVTS